MSVPSDHRAKGDVRMIGTEGSARRCWASSRKVAFRTQPSALFGVFTQAPVVATIAIVAGLAIRPSRPLTGQPFL